MHDPDANTSPFNDIPPLVVVLVLIIITAELVFQLGEAGLAGGQAGYGWRSEMFQSFGFPTAIVEWLIETRRFLPELLLRFVSYPFIHTTFGHALMASVFLLALGKFVGERTGAIVFLLIFFASAAGAALLYALIVGPGAALLGAYPPAYGLIGAFTWILVGRFRDNGRPPWRAFQLIGVLLAIQLIFAVTLGGTDWIADMAGFLCGFVACAVLRPKEAQGIGWLIRHLRREE